MMPRKKRRFIFSILVILIAIIITLIIMLCISTDTFKSNKTLFAKYIGKNFEKIEEIYENAKKSEYNEFLQNNKYTTETKIKVNYTENIGTTSESTENTINQLKLEIEGQTDKINSYDYQDITLLNNDQKISEIEYIQKDNTYGIRFSDLFNQYILVENENLKELFKKLGCTEEELTNIPDKIELEGNLLNNFNFTEDEKTRISTKYLNIINDNTSEENFSKQKNQIIQINKENIEVNAYTLTITKEQLNNIYIKILEEMKQDEIILSKIDEIQKIFNSEVNINEQFTQNIEKLISEITKNNIGQEETKIITYENNQEIVKTTIKTPDYEINLEIPSNNYFKLSYNNIDEEKIFIYENVEQEKNIVLTNIQGEETIEYSFSTSEKLENNNGNRNIIFKYEDNSEKVEANIEQKMKFVDNFENENILNNENSVNLSRLDEEQVKSILNTANISVSSKINEITLDDINTQDLLKVLQVIGLVEEQTILESTGITEIEKNRFNSKFEILQGDNLKAEEVLRIIEAIKDNIINMEVISNTELRLNLDRWNKNEEVVEILSNFIQKDKNKIYNINVEYNETTGLVSNILLTMVLE